MKLIVRSKYWGPNIKGHAFEGKSGKSKPCKVIIAQIDFQNQRTRDRSNWGCCPQHGGRRVMELTESHFLDTHRGGWNLYRTRVMFSKGGFPINEFFLLPENQTSIDVESAVKREKWEFWGTLDACILRMDLEPLLKPFFQEQAILGHTVSHAHLFVLMDTAEDKDPPHMQPGTRAMKIRRKEHATPTTTTQDEENWCCSCSVTTATTATTEGSQEDDVPIERDPIRPPQHVRCVLPTLSESFDSYMESPLQSELEQVTATSQPAPAKVDSSWAAVDKARPVPWQRNNMHGDFPALPLLVQSMTVLNIRPQAIASSQKASRPAKGLRKSKNGPGYRASSKQIPVQ